MKTKNKILIISAVITVFTINGYTQSLKSLKGKPFSEEVLNAKLLKENGDTIKFKKVLKSLKGNVVYLDFWASWCGPCIREMPESKKVQQYFVGKKVVFLYLSTDTEQEKWLQGMKRINITGHHYRISPTDKILFKKLFKIPGIPYYIIIDKKGNIAEPRAEWPREKRALKQIENILKIK